MANIRKWSSTATGNASVAGGANTINFAEGQTPGSVNNSAREVMAQVRGIYTPSEWGWVEFSATASVASQTAFKLTGNQTSDWTAGRRWRLKSGSSTRYGSVVSSSFTAETTITVTVDSGSLSASHSLAALAAIDSNHVPGLSSYVTSASLATSLATYLTSNSASVGYARLGAANTFTANQTINGGNPGLQLNSNTDFTPQVVATHAGATAGSAPYCILNRARGTYSSPTIVSSGDQVGSILFQAHDGSSYRGVADIEAVVDGTTGATDTPGRLLFKTCADGAGGALTERMRIDASGNVLVNSSGGLGYGTGSGGTVTQITSKSTGVTINKTNGQIVTHNANLTAGNTASFTVTNSTVAATDTVIVHLASGGTAERYNILVDAVSAGSFVVTIHNYSVGALAQALTLNFAVIKAVTS